MSTINSTSTGGPSMEFLGHVIYHLYKVKPLLPTYLHLLISADVPISGRPLGSVRWRLQARRSCSWRGHVPHPCWLPVTAKASRRKGQYLAHIALACLYVCMPARSCPHHVSPVASSDEPCSAALHSLQCINRPIYMGLSGDAWPGGAQPHVTGTSE